MKFVIVVLAIVLLAWLLFGRNRRGDAASPRRPRARKQAAVEGMVRCAHCGVHLPASEALASGALHYCSDAHRERGPLAPRP
jgi:uncharacterized protein